MRPDDELPFDVFFPRNVQRVCAHVAIAFLLVVLAVARASAQTDSWATMAPDPHAKTSPAVVQIDGRLYVHGFDEIFPGYPSSFVPRLSIYTPSSNTWAIGASPALIRPLVAVGMINGKMYVVGGCVGSDCTIGVTNALEILRPSHEHMVKWRTNGDATVWSHGRCHCGQAVRRRRNA
jgi:hypothetical protein